MLKKLNKKQKDIELIIKKKFKNIQKNIVNSIKINSKNTTKNTDKIIGNILNRNAKSIGQNIETQLKKKRNNGLYPIQKNIKNKE